MNPEIFREYDIRGLADTDLTDQAVAYVGSAYGTYIVGRGASIVTVGRDVRLSSERIEQCFIQGLRSTGCDVVDVGVVTTPTLYFSILHLEADGGVQITGSHNPMEYNGFKMCREQGIPVYGTEIQELRHTIEMGDFATGEGSLRTQDIPPAYIEAIERRITLDRKLKVVLDAGNGGASEIAPRIFRDLGCEVIPLYCEIDGRFPHHLPDPTIPEYLEDLRRTVLEEKADVGIGYDGDADRIGAVDEQGNIVWGDKLLAIFSGEILQRKPGSEIIFDVKCSQGLIEYLEAHGGKPLMWKTGHSLIKAKMKEVGAPIAGEMSGHMFFSDGYFGYDDALFASARLVQILSQTDRKLSELAAEIPPYVATPEVRVDCPDQEKFRVVEELKEHFRASYEIVDIDGVRVSFGDGWGLLRASNTQPALVLRFEARTEQRMKEIQRIFLDKLRAYPSVNVMGIEV